MKNSLEHTDDIVILGTEAIIGTTEEASDNQKHLEEMDKMRNIIKIKVIYKGFDAELDGKLSEALKGIGAKFNASSINHITNNRNICFDYEVED